MRVEMVVMAILGTAGCAGGKDDSAVKGGDTCTALTTGRWTATGAFGMGDEPMDVDLTFAAKACAFGFSNWSMGMDNLPTGGALDADAVQLDGLDGYWRSCTGTASDETHADGTCADDGAAWSLVLG